MGPNKLDVNNHSEEYKYSIHLFTFTKLVKRGSTKGISEIVLNIGSVLTAYSVGHTF